MSTQTISKIAANTADVLMAIFAGQTVAADVVLAEITAQYAFAKKRPGFTSYFTVTDAIERAGATSYYTGFNYTGEKFFTFPAA